MKFISSEWTGELEDEMIITFEETEIKTQERWFRKDIITESKTLVRYIGRPMGRVEYKEDEDNGGPRAMLHWFDIDTRAMMKYTTNKWDGSLCEKLHNIWVREMDRRAWLDLQRELIKPVPHRPNQSAAHGNHF